MSYKTVLWNSMMMSFKHVLGPARMKTPPATPPSLPPRGPLSMPLMAREPFPVDLITNEKLDEILNYLRATRHPSPRQDRQEVLEGRMIELSNEMNEIKGLLNHLVHAKLQSEQSQS